MAATLLQKVWDAHTVRVLPSGQTQLFVGLHLVHEVTSPQAFDMLRQHELELFTHVRWQIIQVAPWQNDGILGHEDDEGDALLEANEPLNEPTLIITIGTPAPPKRPKSSRIRIAFVPPVWPRLARLPRSRPNGSSNAR